MTWIDPSSADLPYIMPGDLRGITTLGEVRGLQSFGMMGVELTSASGQQLNIADGKKAELIFPLPSSMQATAPASIDLWYFDEIIGIWKQEGQAIKTGNIYKAEVGHFSFWNCDAPFPLVDVCMKLQSLEGSLPLNNVQVRIRRSDGTGAYGRTDSLGNLCGKIPKDEALVLDVVDDCGNIVVSKNIGPFSTNTDIGSIFLEMPVVSSLKLKGNVVNCTNNPVTNGGVLVYLSTGNIYNVPLSNGAFELLVINCTSSNISYSVLPLDNTTQQQGIAVTGSSTTGVVNLGTVQACGSSSVEYIDLIVDGVPFSIVSGRPFNEIFANDSTNSGSPFISIYGSRTEVPNSNGLGTYFKFESVNTTGVADLLEARVSNSDLPLFSLYYFVNPGQTVNITSVGPAQTGFIEGNFTTQLHNNGPPSTVICNFKVRRP
jgi:hypothetical protein